MIVRADNEEMGAKICMAMGETLDGGNLRDVLPSTVVTSENAADPGLWGNGEAN